MHMGNSICRKKTDFLFLDGCIAGRRSIYWTADLYCGLKVVEQFLPGMEGVVMVPRGHKTCSQWLRVATRWRSGASGVTAAPRLGMQQNVAHAAECSWEL